MGCDIHLNQEIKVRGKWLHYSRPSVERDYTLFALMGNVRNHDNLPSLSNKRGVPPDATDMTKLDAEFWGVDGHSHSWLNREEILRLRRLYVRYALPEEGDSFFLSDIFGYLFGNDWDYNPPDMGLEDVRWIFWFDN